MVGRKLKFEFRRVIGRVDIDRKWCVKSVLASKGIYILFGKSKTKNDLHVALMKRIRKAEGAENEVDV